MTEPIEAQLSGPGVPDASAEQKELAALRHHRDVLFEAFAERVRRRALALSALAGREANDEDIDERIENLRDDPLGLVSLADEIDQRFDDTFRRRSRTVAVSARAEPAESVASYRAGEQ